MPGLTIRTETFDQALAYAPSGRVAAPDTDQAGGDFTFCANGNSADAQVVSLTALGQPVLASRHADGREADCSVT